MTSLPSLCVAVRRRGRRGFTLIELLLVLGILTMLLAMMLPSLRSARERAQDVACMSNLRQVAMGLTMYADEQGKLPQRYNWADPDHRWGYDDHLLREGMAAEGVFVCPRHPESRYAEPTHSAPSYGMNWYYDNMPLAVVDRTDIILVADTYGPGGEGSHRADRDSWDGTGYGALDIDRHNRGGRGERASGYAFFDTHVEMGDYFDVSGPVGERWGTDMGDHDRHVWPVP